MHHQRRVYIGEHAALDQDHLAAPALLGRRANHDHAAGQFVHHRPQAHARGDGRRADDVVAAGVPDLGQGVVLGHQRDGRPIGDAARLGPKRGRQPADPAFDDQSMLRQCIAQKCGRLEFLEGQLGLAVDRGADPEELGALCVNDRQRARLQRTGVRHAMHSQGGTRPAPTDASARGAALPQ